MKKQAAGALTEQLFLFEQRFRRVSTRERDASKLLRDVRFHTFELIGRHWPALLPFDEVIEQRFAPAAFAASQRVFVASAFVAASTDGSLLWRSVDR